MEINHIWTEENFIFFNWPICNKCNFKCYYCNAGNSENNNYFSNYKLTISKLKNIKRKFKVCITGGEPTLHPNIEEILKNLSSCEFLEQANLFTNLSKPIEFFKNIDELVSNNITIYASFHPEYHNEEFLKKCLYINKLKNLNFSVNVSIADDKKFWDKTKQILDEFIKNNIDFMVNILGDSQYYKNNYDDSIYNEFKKYFIETPTYDDINIETNNKTFKIKSYELKEKELNKFKGFKCNCNIFKILENDTIVKICSEEKAPMVLKDSYFDEKIICPFEKCESDVMLYYEKWKN